MLNVLYAIFRTRHMGSVSETVCTTSSKGSPPSSSRVAIRVVRVERMLALTPEPRPSEKTSVAR